MRGTYAAFRADPTLDFNNFNLDENQMPISSPIISNFSRPISMRRAMTEDGRLTLSTAEFSRPSSMASSRGPSTPSQDINLQDFLAGPAIVPADQEPSIGAEVASFMHRPGKSPELDLRFSMEKSLKHYSTSSSGSSNANGPKRPCPVHGYRPVSSRASSFVAFPPTINPDRKTPPSPLRESVQPVSKSHKASQVLPGLNQASPKRPCPVHGNRPISSRKSSFMPSPLTIDTRHASIALPTALSATRVEAPLPLTPSILKTEPLSSQHVSRDITESPELDLRFSFEKELTPMEPRTPKAPCPVHGVARPPYPNRKSSLGPLSPAASITDLSLLPPRDLTFETPRTPPLPTSFSEFKEAQTQRQDDNIATQTSTTESSSLPFLSQDPFNNAKESVRPKSAGVRAAPEDDGDPIFDRTNKQYAQSVMSSKSNRSIRKGLSKVRRMLTRVKKNNSQ